MEIDSYSIGYQNGYKDAEDKYKPKELNLEKKEVIRTLNKLANDYLVYPDEIKALDYAIRDLEKPSIIDVLDKIRAEIEAYKSSIDNAISEDEFKIEGMKEAYTDCLEIIDEYKAESEKGIEK